MRKLIQPFLLLLLVVTIFHSWFLPGLLSTFDFPYFSRLMMKDAGMIPYAWGWHVGLDGFAGFLSPYSWVFPFIYIPQVVFGSLGMDWSFIERVMYLYPLLILMIVSPILLTRYIFPKNRFYLLSVLIFSFNTYALMLAGGEIFVALAYALAPIILVLFMHMLKINNLKTRTKYIFPIITGLILAIQIMTDPRITYVTLSAVALCAVLRIMNHVLSKKSLNEKILNTSYLILYTFFIPGAIAVLLHAFWIIPSVLHGGNPVEALGSSHSTVDAVKFLSFAKLENTISLFNPNWPENIFGKVGFMKPEFLVLPIMAYLSLLFVTSEKRKTENLKPKNNLTIIFFAFLGLLGAFLAKGANDPFGQVYLWMFNHVPGFIMFRDPTKWYPLVVISYSILIPFSVWKIYEMLKSQLSAKGGSSFGRKIQKFIPNLFLLVIVFCLLYLIRPVLLGQLGGMFKATNVPQDYVRLEKFLANQPDYFRTLWVPSKQKFGYYSNNHPEISARVLFNITDNEGLFKKLSQKQTEKFLEEASIKYVIVPYDSEKEIFLSDRKYDDGLYGKTLSDVSKISYLKKVQGFGKISVFEVSNPKDHFWSPSTLLRINYKFINPTKYEVNIENAKKGDIIIFSENYDKNWIATTQTNYTLDTRRYELFNGFVLPSDGNYSLKIYYTLQDYVNIGVIISGVTLVVSVGSLFLIFKKK